MNIYPLMNVRFPEEKEGDLLAAMKSRAAAPWSWQATNTHGREPDEGTIYFHRDQVGDDPACAVCIHRHVPGNLAVLNIVPDGMEQLTIPQYVRILREFDALIAEPAALDLGGMTSIDTDRRTLEDYFPAESVRLLERFCKTSNGYGSHPSDQEKWIAFLVHVHRSGVEVHCDVFGACLRAKEWFPDDGIADLVHEYDFAMWLLRQADGTR